MFFPVRRTSESLNTNAVLMEKFGEGGQWRGGSASRGWTQVQPRALRGAATQPSPSFHLAPMWPPEVELSSLPGPGALCPPILFPSGPTSHFANGSNSGLDLTLSEGNPSAGGGRGVGCTSHGVTQLLHCYLGPQGWSGGHGKPGATLKSRFIFHCWVIITV